MSQPATSTHLSIGEVLTLLQADFPDVTISKIRFLESQGLVAPERTASGYRKFYESDIDRLRWILAQQRDNFLPLKVIKRMLDQGADVNGGVDQPALFNDEGASTGDGDEHGEDATEDAHDHGESPAPHQRSRSHPAVASAPASAAPDKASDAAPVGASGTTRPPAGERPHGSSTGGAPADARASGGAAATSTAAESSTPAGAPAGATGSAPSPSVAADTGRTAKESSGRDSSAKDRSARNAAGKDAAGGGGAARGDDSGPNRRSHSTPADVVAALQEDPRGNRRSTPRPGTKDTESAATTGSTGRTGGLGQSPAGENLGRLELCEAAGIDTALLDSLEQFGLVVPIMSGANPTYGPDSLVIANAAARCAELGIEPRHLRIYKIAAEREAGFLEQMVVPLLKQRNPVAKEQAIERTDELLGIGADLHAILLRRQIGPLLGL